MKQNSRPLLANLVYLTFIISVALNLLLAAAIFWGIDIRKNAKELKAKFGLFKSAANGEIPRIPGRWHLLKQTPKKTTPTTQQKRLIEKLESIGYLSGSMEAPEEKNVTIYNEKLAYKGLNLYISGHSAEAILTDLKGKELHKWRFNLKEILPNYKSFTRSIESNEFWRRIHIFENGDLLAIYEGIGLVKLDKESKLLWYFNRAKTHHDLFVNQDGKIYILTFKGVFNRKYHKTKPILDNFITILSAEGKEIRSVSILKCLENSIYAPFLERVKTEEFFIGDIFHTNTIEVLDGRLAHKSPAFREGNVLICIRTLNLICVVDLQIESVVWALSGLWIKPHQPTVLKNGNMLIFDNQGNNGKSRVIEFDPFSQEIIWVYNGTPDMPLFSFDSGSCEKLPNGNILISESNAGRALEVSPDKTIVWEFFNPHRAGENGKLIATLFEAIRLGPDFPLDWLDDMHNNDQKKLLLSEG